MVGVWTVMKLILLAALCVVLGGAVSARAESGSWSGRLSGGWGGETGWAEASWTGEESDADPFAGLIPGERLTDDELERYYGRGFDPTGAINVVIDLGDGSLFTPGDLQFNNVDNGTEFVDQSNESEIFGNSGVLQNTPIIGNNNEVVINVNITVNMNTVSVMDSSGSSVNVTQNLNLSGSIPAFGN